MLKEQTVLKGPESKLQYLEKEKQSLSPKLFRWPEHIDIATEKSKISYDHPCESFDHLEVDVTRESVSRTSRERYKLR